MKKFAMIAIVTLMGSLAQAGILDAPVLENTGGGQTPAACVDGTTKLFYENRANGLDGLELVRRTCVNGSYYPQANPTVRRCVEGSYFVAAIPTNTRNELVTFVCTNGKYIAR